MVYCSFRNLFVFTGVTPTEGRPRTEVIVDHEEFCHRPKSLIQRLAEKRLKTSFCVLDVRQGTILIALLELVVFFFGGIMVAMDLWHELQIKELIISEVEDSPARKKSALSQLLGQEGMETSGEMDNEARLQLGLYLANYRVLGSSCVLLYVVLHTAASGLLLLAAILRKSGMLLMWICLTIADLSITICGTGVAVVETALSSYRKFGVFVTLYIVVSVLHATWLVYKMIIVASLYTELFQMKRAVSANFMDGFQIDVHAEWDKVSLSDLYVETPSGTDEDDDEIRRKNPSTPDFRFDSPYAKVFVSRIDPKKNLS